MYTKFSRLDISDDQVYNRYAPEDAAKSENEGHGALAPICDALSTGGTLPYDPDGWRQQQKPVIDSSRASAPGPQRRHESQGGQRNVQGGVDGCRVPQHPLRDSVSRVAVTKMSRTHAYDTDIYMEQYVSPGDVVAQGQRSILNTQQSHDDVPRA